MSHRLVLHGRYVCKANRPECARCVLCEICPGAAAKPEGTREERAKRMAALVRAP
jgi:endonuclease-3